MWSAHVKITRLVSNCTGHHLTTLSESDDEVVKVGTLKGGCDTRSRRRERELELDRLRPSKLTNIDSGLPPSGSLKELLDKLVRLRTHP